MTNEERNRLIIEKLKSFVPTPEYLEKMRQDFKDREDYMNLPVHDGDCYCSRCMEEFLK